MAEWLKALAWKAGIRQKRIVSSNLIPSAIFPMKMRIKDRTADLAAATVECHYDVSWA